MQLPFRLSHDDFLWLIEFKSDDPWEMTCIRVVLYTLVGSQLLKYVNALLSGLVEFGSLCDRMGLRLITSTEKRKALQQRRRLCTQLKSDLVSLSKGENWNDQEFTDLAAELEANGYYYASALNRFLRIKSRGLRRVPSLLKGILDSADQLLLLTGEPGSGKSVAMRHLALELADRAIRSRAENCLIPLYVNLRELDFPTTKDLTPEFLRDFVIANVRRGDGDLAQVIRERWNDYRDQGRWYFLFDSFDEIPSILHAPHGSRMIVECANALQAFQNANGPCRGIIASRLYKGPQNLHLPTFRILPLTYRYQTAIVQNADLKPEMQGKVLHFLAVERPPLSDNPLFLTLICRFARREGSVPHSDYELLLNHITALAEREPDHLQRKYDLHPSALVEYALEIAYVIARNRGFGLAPTLDELANAMQKEGFRAKEVRLAAQALADVKIGRFDVPAARVGEMRFAFSHRRYQEALAVARLSRKANIDELRSLLTEGEWRDYGVTFMQTQSEASVAQIIQVAEKVLDELLVIDQPPIRKILAIASAIQDGLSRRQELLTTPIRAKFDQLIEPIWRQGDYLVRLQLTRVCGVTSKYLAGIIIRWASACGVVSLEDAAFQQSGYIGDTDAVTAHWLRGTLADKSIHAMDRGEHSRLEALALRLPPEVGARNVLAKGRALRSLFPPLPLVEVANARAKTATSRFSTSITVLVCLAFCAVGAISILFLDAKETTSFDSVVMPILAFALLVWFAFVSIVFLALYTAHPLSLIGLCMGAFSQFARLRRINAIDLREAFMICAAFLLLFFPFTAFALSNRHFNGEIGSFGHLLALMCNFAVLFLLFYIDDNADRRGAEKTRTKLLADGLCGPELLLSVKSHRERLILLQKLEAKTLEKRENVRRLITGLSEYLKDSSEVANGIVRNSDDNLSQQIELLLVKAQQSEN